MSKNRISPTQLLAIISTLPTGTTIFCHNPRPIFCKIIRAGTRAFWDHTATVIWFGGKPFIVEAKGGERIHPKCFYKWIEEREDNTFHVSPAIVDRKRIGSQYGKRYDYGGAAFYMAIHQLTGIWFGPTGIRVQDRWFCFELSAWFRELPEYWCKVPEEFPG